jgi:hypothetical protein
LRRRNSGDTSLQCLSLFLSSIRGVLDRPETKVESRCDAVSIGLAYLFPALSVAGASLASPLIRFHIPLIKPDLRNKLLI